MMLLNVLTNKKKKNNLLIAFFGFLLLVYMVVARFEFDNLMNAFSENYSIQKAFKNKKVDSVYYLSNLYDIDSFNLSPFLKKNGWLYYSIINSNYPKKLSNSSKFYFTLDEENFFIDQDCTLLDRKESVELYECL
jgi:hypothetical protein